MKLNRLEITNFGPYRGDNEFDLRTTPDSPIILFGGKNGAGKTTLFQSVQLCLHGRSALGRRTSASEYESEIYSYLHEGSNGKSENASIRLEFEYANLGERDTYTVERSWRDRGKSIVESLTVRRNDEEIADLEEDQWEDFLKELIPPGVSQLFFFDGEKVQQLATAIEEDSGFEDSLLSLLGLDLVERLEADLSIYLSNKLSQDGQDKLYEELNEINNELNDFNDKIDDIEYQIAEKRDDLSKINRDINQLEEKLAQQGGAYAAKRDELKDERARLRSRKESLEDDLREVIMGSFPFALVPDLCQNVEQRLREETKAQQTEIAREQVIEELDEICEEEDLCSQLDVSTETTQNLVDHLQSALGKRISAQESEQKLVESFSKQQRERMYQIVDRALTDVPERLITLSKDLEDVTQKLTEVEEQINRAPEEPTISPLIEEIRERTENRGQTKEQIDDLDSKREELVKRRTHLETERERILNKETQMDEISERAELAKRTRKAVQTYQKRLINRKFERLEEVLTRRYRQLSNKGEFYQEVHINKEDITIEIETVNGNYKQQSQLSAGERQIFATAILWALAEISDRPLPFIIDTPLGRLDQDHRENIVKNFLPEASHQVLVLSTDTEITEEHYDYISSQTAGEYHLEYNEDEGCTDVSRGYFSVDEAEAKSQETAADQSPIEGFTNE